MTDPACKAKSAACFSLRAAFLLKISSISFEVKTASSKLTSIGVCSSCSIGGRLAYTSCTRSFPPLFKALTALAAKPLSPGSAIFPDPLLCLVLVSVVVPSTALVPVPAISSISSSSRDRSFKLLLGPTISAMSPILEDFDDDFFSFLPLVVDSVDSNPNLSKILILLSKFANVDTAKSLITTFKCKSILSVGGKAINSPGFSLVIVKSILLPSSKLSNTNIRLSIKCFGAMGLSNASSQYFCA
mmetsp:Transcript_15442/g.29136  ORF Transcript_15442/g.29136 Transcript_15442/m.29136 type:complete len:244 (+) Transcript_15442:4694-5425(+)